jgi:hypothetical protein
VIGFIRDGAGENYPEPGKGRREDDLAKCALAIEIVGEPGRLMTARQPRAVSHRALGIDVDQESLHPPPGKRGGEIDCGGGFADSSFLAYD